MKRPIVLFILLTLSILQLGAKDICINQSMDIQSLLSKENTSYIINQEINLYGKTILLPKNSVIKFSDNGKVKNGNIVGNSSRIIAENVEIFGRDIIISGTWNNSKVFGEWAGLTENEENNRQFANIFALCKSKNVTHVYTPEGEFPVKMVNNSAPLIIPSNVHWHNASIIKALPTSFTHYCIVFLNKVNKVTIDGGRFIGDVNEHIGDNGEWGHGIKCGGASNIILKNLSCEYCWGDGIDLIEGKDINGEATINCERLLIENVKCLHNRRQGMSIEAANDVYVRNCEFAHTGIPQKTPPSAGLDIEPWNANRDKVWNITFTNCSFYNNSGFDAQIEPNRKLGNDYKKLVNKIRFNGCTLGTMRIQYTNVFELNDCKITERLTIINGHKFRVKNTDIKELKKPAILNIRKM